MLAMFLKILGDLVLYVGGKVYSRQFKEPCSPGLGLLLFSSTPRNETDDKPRKKYQTVPIKL